MTFRARQFEFVFPRPALVMGIVNVTPDSFSDGGKFFDTAAAVDCAVKLSSQGAEILDIGGESTRPGAAPVSEDEELRRVIPVLEALAGSVSGQATGGGAYLVCGMERTGATWRAIAVTGVGSGGGVRFGAGGGAGAGSV